MDGNGLLSLAVIIYCVWGIYSGYKFLTGRSAWLDTRKAPNMVVKFSLSFVVGMVIAAFYFIYLIFKLLFSFWKNW